MTRYEDMDAEGLRAAKAVLEAEHERYRSAGLALDMSRGKPASAQLDLSMPMLDLLSSASDLKSASGADCRNYGIVDGLPEAKELMSWLLDDEPTNVIVFGNASLNIMYDMVARFMAFGTLGSMPWNKLDEVKWLCPVPGYDRHFSVTEAFGITMLNIPMDAQGPCMDTIEGLVAQDASIKGIWCVPKYSNPSGITYSDEVVRRLASMECAAPDFRIFWDNAYAVHHLSDDPSMQDSLLDIGLACKSAGNPHRYLKFASTSKVTFPGAGISGLAASPENIAEVLRGMGFQTIGHDKLNQLRHVRFLKDRAALAAHMARHAAIIAPKFDLVCRKLEEGLGAGFGVGIGVGEGQHATCTQGTQADPATRPAPGCLGSWNTPRGGYFISFDAPEGTARRIVALAKEAGVVMTGAGASYPYGKDPLDSNIRIAPTLPPLAELETAMDVFVCCVKLASVEKLLEERLASQR